MGLTQSEIKYSEKSIRRLEKDSRQWPWMRWIMLAGSILMIGFGVYEFKKIANLKELISSVFSINPQNFNSETTELFVKGQMASFRLELLGFLKILVSEAVGVIWLIYCLVNWNRHLKSAIKAKALSRFISEN
jgi:hypothetical protein